MTLRQIPFVLLVCLALAGCKQESLYVGLQQTEANEILSLMYAAGLPAEKVADKEGTYSITTSKDTFAQAMALLQANGLPREEFESMGEVFQKEGFVSSPLEERARLNFALSQEIAHTISSIDGVITARVHLVIPVAERLTRDRQPASASVFVKHRADVDLSGAVGKIKSIVINGVENLPYENVTVAFFDARAYEPPQAAVPAQTVPSGAASGDRQPLEAMLAFPGTVWLVVPLVLAGLGGYAVWRRRGSKPAARKPATGEVGRHGG